MSDENLGVSCRVWASYVNHHGSQHYNLTTALRQTWTYKFTFMVVVHAQLILLGFHPAMVLFVGGLNLIYQVWIHAEVFGKMPRWFEAVMNTSVTSAPIMAETHGIRIAATRGLSSSGANYQAHSCFSVWRTFAL